MPFTQQEVSLLTKDSLCTKHANPLEMAQNAPKLQRGFPARCQSSAPQTNTFNLTVKLDFSTLPLRLWGRRSIPCHSLSCKSGGNWHLRCSLSKWENTRVHSERCCFPSMLSAELSISEKRIKFAHFPFCIFSFSGLRCAYSTRQGGFGLRLREGTSSPQTVCLQLSENNGIEGYFGRYLCLCLCVSVRASRHVEERVRQRARKRAGKRIAKSH